MVKPDNRQCTLKHGKVLIEAIAAGFESLELRGKVERKLRFHLVTHDPDPLFSIVANNHGIKP